ncbi:hypothetical protein BAE44_0002185 [Dichanthelium oligosanthes]|uniref:Uncharacterized protein n=1 Tax=Dichanthelium oligosanthes TaxID=888268 RepID=A0A1E5WHH5_9POAL|nr:hypothetical protein BAE44_0002185 [Dichanthelium oligosanthes]
MATDGGNKEGGSGSEGGRRRGGTGKDPRRDTWSATASAASRHAPPPKRRAPPNGSWFRSTQPPKTRRGEKRRSGEQTQPNPTNQPTQPGATTTAGRPAEVSSLSQGAGRPGLPPTPTCLTDAEKRKGAPLSCSTRCRMCLLAGHRRLAITSHVPPQINWPV